MTKSYVDQHGYVMVRDGKRWRKEHRVVMERRLGRPLRRDELVHHRNLDKTDNRPENLRVYRSHAKHFAHHRLRRSAKFLGRYAEFVSVVRDISFEDALEFALATRYVKQEFA